MHYTTRKNKPRSEDYFQIQKATKKVVNEKLTLMIQRIGKKLTSVEFASRFKCTLVRPKCTKITIFFK